MTGTGAVRVGAPLVVILALLAAWQAFVVLGEVPTLLLPSPTDIAAVLAEDLAYLTRLALATGRDAGIGTVVAVVAALLVGWVVHGSNALSSMISSLAVALKALPIVALFPIVTVFLGKTSVAVIAIVAISGLPIMLVYTLQGLRQSSRLDDLMHVIAAGPVRRTWSLRLPRAVPFLVTGLRTVLPLSVITAIIAEYFGGQITTLGTYIRRESANLHTVTMWSAIVMACLLGLVCSGIGLLVERLARAATPGVRAESTH
ncbi:MAG TPA: ABC transporter permease subunit [Cellulomonas sp.]